MPIQYEDSPEDFMTFDEWKEERRHVKRGETSHTRNYIGEAVFHVDQTDEDDDGDENQPLFYEDEFREW